MTGALGIVAELAALEVAVSLGRKNRVLHTGVTAGFCGKKENPPANLFDGG